MRRLIKGRVPICLGRETEPFMDAIGIGLVNGRATSRGQSGKCGKYRACCTPDSVKDGGVHYRAGCPLSGEEMKALGRDGMS